MSAPEKKEPTLGRILAQNNRNQEPEQALLLALSEKLTDAELAKFVLKTNAFYENFKKLIGERIQAGKSSADLSITLIANKPPIGLTCDLVDEEVVRGFYPGGGRNFLEVNRDSVPANRYAHAVFGLDCFHKWLDSQELKMRVVYRSGTSLQNGYFSCTFQSLSSLE